MAVYAQNSIGLDQRGGNFRVHFAGLVSPCPDGPDVDTFVVSESLSFTYDTFATASYDAAALLLLNGDLPEDDENRLLHLGEMVSDDGLHWVCDVPAASRPDPGSHVIALVFPIVAGHSKDHYVARWFV